MKILHTSDWHLGHTFYGYDRAEEQAGFLRQLAAIVAEERPDVMAVSGDVYHYSNPSASTQRMYTDGMLCIHEACPSMRIVVTAGNHDSSSRLEIDSSLWLHFRVNVVGHIARDGDEVDWEKHLIEVDDEAGNPLGVIAAVPHIYPQNYPVIGDCPREQRQACFFQALLDKARQKRGERALPIVLMAHLAIAGSDRAGQEEAIGDIEYVPLSDLGDGYDYMALGHIHHPQDLTAKARYCGTPVAVSFDENCRHSVSIVEAEAGQPPRIRTVEIQNPLPPVTIPAAPLPFDEALRALESFPGNRPAYVRLNVSFTGYLPQGCYEKAVHAAQGKKCRFCYIKSNKEGRAQEDAHAAVSVQDIKKKSPLDIARLYYKENVGEEMDEELCELMKFAIQQVYAGKSE